MNIRRIFPSALGLLAFGQLATAQNLIENGGFESADWAWGAWPEALFENPHFTSQYQPVVPISGSMYGEGTYTLGSNPNSYNPNFHSFSAYEGSNMMIVNGNIHENIVVWQSELLAIDPNTTYQFEAFLRNANSSNMALPILEFQIFDGTAWQEVGTINLGDVANPNSWNQFNFAWNSGSSTAAQLLLINRQTAAHGNDFAMDGLSFVGTGAEAIPEPTQLAFLGIGSAALLLHGLRRRKRA